MHEPVETLRETGADAVTRVTKNESWAVTAEAGAAMKLSVRNVPPPLSVN